MNNSTTGTHLARRKRFGFATIVLLAVVGVTIAGYKCRHSVFPKRFGVVVPGQFYRSGQISRFLIESTLQEHGIRTIVDLSGLDENHPDQRAERAAARKLGIPHHRFPLRGDGTGDIESYAAALEVILRSRDARQPVLVHCAAGSQRTGGTVAAYRLLVERGSEAQVLEELARYDWDPRHDRALVDYLDEHWEPLVRSLVRRGVLKTPPATLPRLAISPTSPLPLAQSAPGRITH